MKKIGIFIINLFFVSLVFANENTSPVGLWKTIDDVTGQPKAIIEISASPQHILSGRVLKIFPSPGHDQNEVCEACTGDKHNQKIVGMIVLTGLMQDKDQPNLWEKGEILDPKNGKTYHCNMQTIEQGQKLSVRGYIGVPLFGRSQTWMRVDKRALQ